MIQYCILAVVVLVLSACSTKPVEPMDYLAETSRGTYLCDRFESGPYGLALSYCEHVMDGSKVTVIINPTRVIEVKEIK